MELGDLKQYEDLLQWELQRRDLMSFICAMNAKYVVNWHHAELGKRLSKLRYQTGQRIIIQLPPQVGKSEIISRYFPAWLLGNKPEHKIILASYAAELAESFNRDVQRIMDLEAYQSLFPETRLNETNLKTVSGGWKRTSNLFEVVEHGGYLKTVGVGGATTGARADCFVAGTMVTCYGGPRPIEDLKPGDMVLTFNHQRGCAEWAKVQATRKRYATDLAQISTQSGKRFCCTADHRVFSGNSYREAGRCEPGDRLIGVDCPLPCNTPQIRQDSISSVECYSSAKIEVYDIQTEKNHNFFAEGILVHNCFIVDDPVKGRKEADSPTNQKTNMQWFQSVATTRCSKDANIIITHTAWSLRDIAFQVMELQQVDPDASKWERWWFPAIAEGALHPTDPRQPGEPLWPSWYGDEREMRRKRADVGTREWNSLYQCRPTADGGNIIKEVWIQYYDQTPPLDSFDQIIQSWDLRFSAKHDDNDFVVGSVWGSIGGEFYLLDLVRGRWGFSESLDQFEWLSRKWPQATLKLVENKANGPALEDMLKKQISGIVLVEPQGSKEQRTMRCEALFEAGNVKIPRNRSWTPQVVYELTNFPSAPHDDILDTATQALIRLHRTTGRSYEVRVL